MSDLAPRPTRVVTLPFVAVTAVTLVFFTSIGITLVTVPLFVERELDAGEFGIGLTIASFAAAAIAARPLITRLGDRFGRRRLMMGGAVLAAAGSSVAGMAGTLPVLLVLRGITGIGEAALFVGAITLIADLSPPDRRAEGASYFSIAVFGGLGVGPVLGEWVLADVHYERAFLTAGALALATAVLALLVPRSVDRVHDADDESTGSRRGILHPAAVGPGLVLASIVAAFSTFTAFIPEHARAVGLSGAGGLFLVYSAVCLVGRVAGAKLPDRIGPGRAVTTALVFVGASLLLLAAVPRAMGAVGRGGRVRGRHGVQLPVADGDRRQPRRRARAGRRAELVHDVLRARLRRRRPRARWCRRVFGKRTGFAGGIVCCAIGLVVLWTKVVVPAPARRDRRPPVPAPRL